MAAKEDLGTLWDTIRDTIRDTISKEDAEWVVSTSRV